MLLLPFPPQPSCEVSWDKRVTQAAFMPQRGLEVRLSWFLACCLDQTGSPLLSSWRPHGVALMVTGREWAYVG